MKTTKFVLLLSAPIFIAYACSLSSDVTVINFSPEGKVNQLTKFTVEFSYNIAPIEKQNQWLTDQFVEFEPNITVNLNADIHFRTLRHSVASILVQLGVSLYVVKELLVMKI